MRIIAGPCVHEDFDTSLKIAKECKRVCDKHDIEYYFKASFDKANRTHNDSERGMGLDGALAEFRGLKENIPELKTLTDVHDVYQVLMINNVYNDTLDVLQVPAFLCRQTDLVRAVSQTDKIVNIKKGQFLAPWDVESILSKTEGAKEVWITERGTSFGYNTLVVDFTGIEYMLTNYDVPIVLDATHAVQTPGGNGTSSGGNRNYVPGLTRAASALGVDNFFLEVHPNPDKSPSDGPNMIRLDNFEKVVDDIVGYSYSR